MKGVELISRIQIRKYWSLWVKVRGNKKLKAEAELKGGMSLFETKLGENWYYQTTTPGWREDAYKPKDFMSLWVLYRTP